MKIATTCRSTMNTNGKAVLVDIDHTLTDARHRDTLIGTVSWDEYHAGAKTDPPVWPLIHLVNALQIEGSTMVGLTSRPEKFRKLTMEWLLHYGVELDEILMRPSDDFRPSPELKVALAKDRFTDLKNQVLFLLDDRQDVIEAFRALGIITLQVHIA